VHITNITWYWKFLFYNIYKSYLIPGSEKHIINILFSSCYSIIRIIKARRWAGHVARMGEQRNAYRLLVGKPKGRRPLGRPRRRWVDNIKMDLVEVGWGDVDWIGLAQDRDRRIALVNSVLNLRVP
jgi:hypothetical protein